jgi:hypothetical protein
MRKTPIRPDEMASVAVWLGFQGSPGVQLLQPPKGKVGGQNPQPALVCEQPRAFLGSGIWLAMSPPLG